ncbi:UNVERIFIED_CONTAM: hypothetical protein Sangu_3037800 [Sesamum angustifolium]|uniref:Chromo domain-containing protein n=1 Tax=Sesamum angustifolium TaxID=2727405 RepID=A0AAW2KGD7_9LAMI
MGRRYVEFSVGDQVLLKLTPQIWKKISSKSVHRRLIPKYDGPFEDLLDTVRQQTHHAPPMNRKEFEKTVLKILDHKTMGQSKKNRRTNYLIHWSGESEADATWERDVTLWQFEEKLDEYWTVREGVTPPTKASGSSGGGVRQTVGWATKRQCARAGKPHTVGGRAWQMRALNLAVWRSTRQQFTGTRRQCTELADEGGYTQAVTNGF